ncbi:hypothetical protein ACS0PU_005344 [Formica fusca]
MSKRKSFNNLSKSQKNRRIKKEYDSLLEMPGGPSCDAEKITVKEVIKSKTDGEYADNVKSLNNLQAIPISENYCHVVSSVESDVNEETSTENNTSTDNELYDIPESEKTVDLKEQMAQWICHNNVTHTAARALLKILRNNVQSVQQLRELPKDPRTLLNTPRSTVIRSVPPGEYFHYGLQKGLIDQLKTVGVNKISENIQINVHIDGLPISKSSKSQLYPILVEIFPKVAELFVVGIYHGYNKPDRCDVFLQEFIKEYSTLQRQGFQYYDRTFKIIIRAIICDSPARSFVTCTKGHNGFFGCGKCMQEGEYEDRRMLFLEMDAPLRTDDNFLQRVNEDYHIGKSIFEKVNIGMVSQFPVEYMHLVCLGVTKKILKAFTKGWHVNENQIVKFNSKMMKEISEYSILSRK